VTRITAVLPGPLASAEAAAAWLREVRSDARRAQAEVAAGVELINRALHAHRLSARDPGVPDAAPGRALAVRVGWGEGGELAESEWTDAVEVPTPPRRRARDEVGPQERMAAIMRGAERPHPAELMLLRARADLAAGRLAEAALQLEAAERALAGGPGDAPGAASLRERMRALESELRERGGD